MITGLCLYIALGTIVFLVAATLVWEFEFEGLYRIPWLRVGVQAIYALGLLLFLGPLALWWKNQPARRIFRLLSMAAAYTLLLSLARSGQVDDALFAASTADRIDAHLPAPCYWSSPVIAGWILRPGLSRHHVRIG